MSTAADPPSAILIPSLPNDMALQCLARVPRRYHPVLSAVSKPIRSLLSSPEFFAARSTFNCTEQIVYVRILTKKLDLARWFAIHGRPNPNSSTGNITKARISAIPNDRVHSSLCAVVGPKIYIIGRGFGDLVSTEMWILDCRSHTWEQGPSMPSPRADSIAVLNDKIYVIRWRTKRDSWFDVFDTVAGRWETLPSPELGVDDKPVIGCTVRGGKVCIWLDREELRFDPAAYTWEVFESSVGLGLECCPQMCQVNGVLYYSDDDNHINCIKVFDETTGVWKELKLVDNRGLPDDLQDIKLVNVGERLVISGLGLLDLETKVGLWCVEIEVKKDRDGDFRGEVLWSEMVYVVKINRETRLFWTCMPVSL